MPSPYQSVVAAARTDAGSAFFESIGDCPMPITPAQRAEASAQMQLPSGTVALDGWAVHYWLWKSGAYQRAAAGDPAGAIAAANQVWPGIAACAGTDIAPPNAAMLPASSPGATIGAGAFNSSALWLAVLAIAAVFGLQHLLSDE